ncbi:MAG: hypothetical protein E7157_02265 [Lactobacillales bacterium]|nr:hypothetical protein [Lactobacillales bacterium]
MNIINVYVNETCGFDIGANRNNIPKEDIVDNLKKAYGYKGCKNITRSRDEHGIKYTAKFDTFKDYNVIIPASSLKANKQMIKELNTICKLMKLKRKEIQEARMKKVFVGACIVLAGAFVVEKAAPVLDYAAKKVVEWDNENFERELEESGAIEMQQNLEMQKNHEAAMEQFYQDKKVEEQQLQQQISEFEAQQEQFNQEQTQKMIDDMEQYRDFDTMPGVTKIEESDVKVR